MFIARKPPTVLQRAARKAAAAVLSRQRHSANLAALRDSIEARKLRVGVLKRRREDYFLVVAAHMIRGIRTQLSPSREAELQLWLQRSEQLTRAWAEPPEEARVLPAAATAAAAPAAAIAAPTAPSAAAAPARTHLAGRAPLDLTRRKRMRKAAVSHHVSNLASYPARGSKVGDDWGEVVEVECEADEGDGSDTEMASESEADVDGVCGGGDGWGGS